MRLTSEPKPVNFRLVIDQTEITSLEDLQENLDFRLLGEDKTLLISWLNNKKYEDKGIEIEIILNGQDDINADSFLEVLNVIYDKQFDDIYQYLDYWFNEYKHEKLIKSFVKFLTRHDNIVFNAFRPDQVYAHLGNEGVKKLFYLLANNKDAKANDSISWMLSWVYYLQGDYAKSQEIRPKSYVLTEVEHNLIDLISRDSLSEIKGRITGNNWSIIGTEFIFLCLIGLKGAIYNTTESNLFVKLKKDLHDQWWFTHLFHRIKKYYKVEDQIKELGYNTPPKEDPLRLEKMFLSSRYLGKEYESKLIDEIREEYFPADFCVENDGDIVNSEALKVNDKDLNKRWLNHILEYHDNPLGLTGDESNRKTIRLNVLLSHFYHEAPIVMKQYFCKPITIGSQNENWVVAQYVIDNIEYLQKKYSDIIGNNSLLLPRLNKHEKPFVVFFKQVVETLTIKNFIPDLHEASKQYDFTKYFEKLNNNLEDINIELGLDRIYGGGPLYVEKSFLLALLRFCMNDFRRASDILNNKSVYSYGPARAFNYSLDEPSKTILDGASCPWYTRSRLGNTLRTERVAIIRTMITRWIANCIYYIFTENEQK